ncbi:conserved hypothetical protein [Vibrio phage 277E43-1]|nr:conserved hypothetical protein [Vibrio phage 277E43-1]
MRSNKYLVMQINDDSALFLNSNFSGGRCASPSDNTTKFRPHDVTDSHDNDWYWNSAEGLLVGFCRWYNRVDEKEAYQMGNRIYSANNTYRFFRVEDEDKVLHANVDLASYEITEETFITEMVNSWAFQQVSRMFAVSNFVTHKRTDPAPIKVDLVINTETNTWCWVSDYLKFEHKNHLTITSRSIPVGKSYKQAVECISCTLGCKYQFGGNDEYLKSKEK